MKEYQKKWLQRVQRMDTNRLPKQALQYKPKGRRNIGRPRKRWRDHLEDQGTGNTPNPSGTWWWWWWWWYQKHLHLSNAVVRTSMPNRLNFRIWSTIRISASTVRRETNFLCGAHIETESNVSLGPPLKAVIDYYLKLRKTTTVLTFEVNLPWASVWMSQFWSCFRVLCLCYRVSKLGVNKCPTRCNYKQFILSVNCSTCFSTHHQEHNNGWLVPDAVGIVICAPDDAEVCHPRCVWKTNSEVNSIRKHNYNCMLDDGIY